MKDVLLEERDLVSIPKIHRTDAFYVAVPSMLPRTAPYQGFIPQGLHLQAQPRTSGCRLQGKG
eukprot:6615076-Prorocentrum_lima.AAC.1